MEVTGNATKLQYLYELQYLRVANLLLFVLGMRWYEVIGVGVLGILGFFLSIFVPLMFGQFIKRRFGKKWVDHPITILAALLLWCAVSYPLAQLIQILMHRGGN